MVQVIGDVKTQKASGAAFEEAVRGKNSLTPQQQLVALIKNQLDQVNSTLDEQKQPPNDYFRSSAVLNLLLGNLRAEYHSITTRSKEQGTHSLFGQLVALEIKAIEHCVSSGCITQAKSLLNEIQEWVRPTACTQRARTRVYAYA